MEYGAVFLWWALYATLAVAGLPIAAALFPRLEGRGAAFGLPIALVVLFTSVYWIGRVTFGPGAVALGVGILLAASAFAYTRSDPEIEYRRFGGWLAVFTVAFLFLVAVRAVDPAVRPIGGEKFLDFGLLKTILRDTALPPEDMWFAGEPVQYYYGGHLLSATLTIITGAVPIDGTAPRYAYNLALAGFYAALVSTAYGLAGSIAAARDASYRTGGLLGAFFVGIASNLVTPLQVALQALPDDVAGLIAERVATLPAGERGSGLQPGELTGGFDGYWTPTRVIEGTINEFPLFAWLNGDLHAHMMSTPFLLLLAGIVFAYYRTPEEEITRRRLLLFGAAPPIAGTIAVVNTWSFPSTAGLAFLGAMFADADPWTVLAGEDGTIGWPAWLPDGPKQGLLTVWNGMGTLAVLTRTDGVVRLLKREYRAAVAWLNGTRSGRELKRAGAALLVGGGVLVIGAAWVLPFLLGPATGAGGRSPWLVPDRTGWSGFLLVHGWVLAVFVAFFAVRATDWDRSSETAGWMAVAGVAALGVLAVLLDAAAFAFLLPLFLFGWVTLRRSDALGFESVLFVAGAGLVLLVEVIYLKEQAGPGRLNTVFKTYMQVWILWATATGAALAILIPGRPLLAAMDGAAAGLSAEDPGGDSKRLRGQAAAVLSVLLVVSMSMYGVFALGAHFEDAPEPSLDATAYVEESRPTEAPAIAWLDDREGKPTIVTAAPGGYRWSPRTGRGASAPSSLTGVPTVLGWFHERGYRGTGPYQQRLAEVETIYTGAPGERAALLAEHDVEYVYAGPAERAEYGEANVSEFSTMEGVSLARSWSPEMTIYRVDQSALAAS